MRLIAMEKGMMVCSQLDPLVLWLPPVQSVQKTVSQVSQNSSSCNSYRLETWHRHRQRQSVHFLTLNYGLDLLN